jgi:hypothetical protein
MSKYNYLDDADEKPRRKAAGQNPDVLWNVLTVLMLVLSLCAGGFFLSVLTNPQTALNPLKPPTPLPVIVTFTPTWTPISLGPTWTPTSTIQASETPTLRPTITPFPSATPLVFPTATSAVKPSRTPTATASPKPDYAFTASVTSYDSTISHPEAGCNWFGVAGQVSDLKNNPVNGLIVKLVGSLNNNYIDQTSLSGIAKIYGEGWFEFVLGDKPLDTKNAVYVQLLDQAGVPLSDKIYITTYSACNKNLTIVRFKQVK